MTDKKLPLDERVWIFQCNPLKYKIEKALLNEEVKKELHWKVNQHRNEIAKGDFGLIWRSGKSAGILAITELISDPGEFSESDAEIKYWNDQKNEKGVHILVKMKVIQNLNKPLTKAEIKNTKGLQDLSILKMCRGTNFEVKPDEWIILKKLIEKQIPLGLEALFGFVLIPS